MRRNENTQIRVGLKVTKLNFTNMLQSICIIPVLCLANMNKGIEQQCTLMCSFLRVETLVWMFELELS